MLLYGQTSTSRNPLAKHLIIIPQSDVVAELIHIASA
jgi:hypothetical protein